MSLFDIHHVSKQYTKKGQTFFAVQDVCLQIDSQDIYGIIGSSGAGKSTFLRLLATLSQPSFGTISYQGQNIQTMSLQRLRAFRHRIGMIFQSFNLFQSRNVEENITYPLEITGVDKRIRTKRAQELLQFVGLQEKSYAYPSQLSGGEQQRVGIARALANQPEVLFCDEATSSLDPRTTHEILGLLRKVHKELGVTIILVTHEMQVVKELCNKVAIFDEGRMIEQGCLIDIFTAPQHPMTQHLIETSTHCIPKQIFVDTNDRRKVLKLIFKGEVTNRPIISEISRRFMVNANIIVGWIDHVPTLNIGTLVIELTGTKEGVLQAQEYLQQHNVQCEEL
jgi:D-methionine transport system ATP-binding protein